MNGLLRSERTIEQTTETMPPSPKTITAANNEENCKLTRAATLLEISHWSRRLWTKVVFNYEELGLGWNWGPVL